MTTHTFGWDISLSGLLRVLPWLPGSTRNLGLLNRVPQIREPAAGQRAGLGGCWYCEQDPASLTSDDQSLKQSWAGALFSHLHSCQWGTREAPAALNHVWKHLLSPIWEGAAGHPRGYLGLGREGVMSGEACVVGTHDLAQLSFLHHC